MPLWQRILGRGKSSASDSHNPVVESTDLPSEYAWWLNLRLTELAEAEERLFCAYTAVVKPVLVHGEIAGREESEELIHAALEVQRIHDVARDYSDVVDPPWPGFTHGAFVNLLHQHAVGCMALVLAVGEGELLKAGNSQLFLAEKGLLTDAIHARLGRYIVDRLPEDMRRQAAETPELRSFMAAHPDPSVSSTEGSP
jgi:hypothetical protein